MRARDKDREVRRATKQNSWKFFWIEIEKKAEIFSKNPSAVLGFVNRSDVGFTDTDEQTLPFLIVPHIPGFRVGTGDTNSIEAGTVGLAVGRRKRTREP